MIKSILKFKNRIRSTVFLALKNLNFKEKENIQKKT